MKRTALALSIIWAFLFSVVLLCSIKTTTANPAPYGTHGLSTPNTAPPIITVQTPHNNTIYNVNDIPVNFTVAKPDSWDFNNSVRAISYTLDGNKTSLWTNTLGQGATDYIFPSVKELSTVLEGVDSGKHVLCINVTSDSKYWPNPDFMFPSYYQIENSQTIIFTVDAPLTTPSSTEPPLTQEQPRIILGVAVTTAVLGAGVGLLVCLLKRK
jgi:hypothetical protein